MNLVDPNFCDDNYRRVTLALEEYTNNIQAVAECMYDVVRQVNYPKLDDQLMVSVEKEAVEIEAMRATNRLIKIHKALLETSQTPAPVDSPRGAGDGQEAAGSSGRRQKGRKGSGKRGKGKKSPREDQEFEEDMKEIAEMTRQHSQTLGNTVLTLINELIEKYHLPDDLMERIEERIIRQYSDDQDGTKTDQKSKKKGKKPSAAQVKAIKYSQEDTHETVGSPEVAKEKKETKEEKVQKKEKNDTPIEGLRRRQGTTEEKEESPDQFEEQFYAALEEKFSIKLSDKETVCVRGSEVVTEIDEIVASKPEESVEEVGNELVAIREETQGATGGEVELAEDGQPKRKKQDLSLHFKKTNEGFMVNFYTLSAAFINELQVIKSKSLDKRKEKALAELHERIQTMKYEMEKIEDAVTLELAKAYDRKMKKSAKQREKMNEKQKQLRDAERLLNFYAQTGQHDKIRAMNEELDRICGNPN